VVVMKTVFCPDCLDTPLVLHEQLPFIQRQRRTLNLVFVFESISARLRFNEFIVLNYAERNNDIKLQVNDKYIHTFRDCGLLEVAQMEDRHWMVSKNVYAYFLDVDWVYDSTNMVELAKYRSLDDAWMS
jgi:hypothetical protein